MEAERQLVVGVKKGDDAARRDLYARYSGMAMAVCMRYVADADAARDVLHDSFVKIFTTVARFEYRGEGSLKAWVMRIVANQSLDYLRQNARLNCVHELPDDLPDEEPDVGLVPPRVLHALVQRLPDGYRAVLNLHVFEGKSHKEIAALLGVMESTSASQFLRAKKTLASMIREYLNRQST